MKPKKRRNTYHKSVYQSLALIMQFGLNMLVPIVMMTALGIYLDKKFDTSFIMIILFLVGTIAGGQNIYRMSKKVYSTPPHNRREHKSSESRKVKGEENEEDSSS